MLEAVNLSKTYQQHEALKPLNLTVKPGEIFCLLGANGAGKSTTINLFLNFIEPTSGKALINGIDVASSPLETKKFLTYIPENLMLYPMLTGVENLDFFCGLSSLQFKRDELAVYLAQAGLQEDFFNQRVSTYSKGMRQKVGIALAIAKKAQVLLLDEPTSGLDPKASNEFSELLIKMKEIGVATLMATHDLFRSKDTGTHIGIMKQGQLLENFEAADVSFDSLEKLYLQHMHN
ncbi:ABC transporter ATP-binding protein [Pedobacter jamesrossensis]|uniref:ABC transporter ATP-binding protein n=1 Tax=Pedobacter jamesrossensis TaxID=1908238 RepID=A0ABV8NPG5_9SPHI